MGETAAANHHHHHHGHQVFDAVVPSQPAFKCFDDDGRLKRTGNNLEQNKNVHILFVFVFPSFIVCYERKLMLKRKTKKKRGYYFAGTAWTASAHIITAVIGSGVLSLAWAIAQLGWIAGPAVMLMFSFVTLYSSTLLSDCYRTGDAVSGKRNYTYMDAVRSILGTKYS